MKRGTQSGFTLLEVLVATTIMGIAVVGLLSSLSTSTRNAARLTAYDRSVMASRAKMDELLADYRIPFNATLTGDIGPDSGWQARFSPYEGRPGFPPGTPYLERVELDVWWSLNGDRHTFHIEGYRRNTAPPPGQL